MPEIDRGRPIDLARFVDAQSADCDHALQELRSGTKRSHWMWYVFPQFQGLGSSDSSRRYAIRSRAEAAAYLAHPVLGPRLRECAEALLAHHARSARQILGTPDDLKLHSSATLFAEVEGAGVFTQLLQRFFDGEVDQKTLEFLRASEQSA